VDAIVVRDAMDVLSPIPDCCRARIADPGSLAETQALRRGTGSA
jgi:hypothetical protein